MITHLLRRLAGPASIAALLAGCSQSLFANPGDGSDTPDGGDDGRIDAGDDPRDAGPVRDGGDGEADARLSLECPEPCLGDAVVEFTEDMSGAWFYATDLPDLFGFSSTDMSFGDIGGADAWHGDTVPTPAIVHCPSSTSYPNCAGMGDKLLFETTERDAPTLAWLRGAQLRPTYRFSGEWRVPSGVPMDKIVTLRVVRNSEFDVLHEESLSTEETAGTFDFELDALTEDNFRVIAISGDSTRVPVALSFYASGTQSESACLLAPDFPDSNGIQDPIPNACDTPMFVHSPDDAGSCPTPNPTCPRTRSTTGPLGLLTNARQFVAGSSLVYQGGGNDYSGDWTVQFWAYLDGDATGTEMLISDANCFAERGIQVYRRTATVGTSEMVFEAFYPDDQADRCLLGPASLTTSVANEAWHFFRLSRSVEDQRMYLCIDGQYAGNVPVPDRDMTATEPMRLGRDALTPAVFSGNLADLRVFKRALPCSGQ